MIAFIGPSELTIAAVVGLLLFGGKLPEVMRQVGRVWFGFRRSLNDLKRETGLEDALRDIRQETGGIRDIANEFKNDLDPFASAPPSKWPPADKDEAEDAEVEPAHKAWSSPTDTVAEGDDLPDSDATKNEGEKCVEPEHSTEPKDESKGANEKNAD